MYNTLPLRHQIPSLTSFQTTPHSSPYLAFHITINPHYHTHFISHHHSSPYHTFHITDAVTFRSTLFHSLAMPLTFHIAPHTGNIMHHISHCTPFHITFHITPHSMYPSPHLRSHHISATLCITSHLTTFRAERGGGERWDLMRGDERDGRVCVSVLTLTKRERAFGERDPGVCVSECERDMVCVFFV